MADLAFGISTALVTKLRNKVQNAIKEEEEQWKTFESHVRFIKDEFEMMQSFLNNANQKFSKNDDVAKGWVKQLCDLSHETEDCIDSAIDLDTSAKQSSMSWCRRLLPSCVAGAALPLDVAVAKMESLRTRVEVLGKRKERYNVSSDSGSKAVARIQETTLDHDSGALNFSANAEEVKKDQIAFVALKSLITTDNKDVQVTSVCGGGLGASSIIRMVYEDSDICSEFKCRAWVRLDHPFNPEEFVRNMIDQFNANTHRKPGVVRGGQDLVKCMKRLYQRTLVMELEELVKTKKYLFILEDLTSIADWDAVARYLPKMKNGSQIIVSTQHPDIASMCVSQPYQISRIREFSLYCYVDVISKATQYMDGGNRSGHRDLSLLARESEANQLEQRITSASRGDKCAMAVAVLGISGVGKSYLVRTVFESCRVKRPFAMYAWVRAPQKFEIEEFFWILLLELSPVDYVKTKDAVNYCRYLLHNYRCLVVIDRLEVEDHWNTINVRLSLGTCTTGSCVVAVTRNESVARHRAMNNEVFHVKGLLSDAALGLFQRKVNRMAGSPHLDAETVKKAEHFLSMCGGLPVAVLALCSYVEGTLSQKSYVDSKADINNSITYLEANFVPELNVRVELTNFKDSLVEVHSRFQGCSQVLKKCVVYLSIFPPTCTIRRSRLVRRWIAEGYFEGNDSIRMVEDAENLFYNLDELGIIRQEPYQIYSLVLEYIISRESEASILLPLEITVLDGEKNLRTERVGQHLTVRSCWMREQNAFVCLDFAMLRSLTVSGEWQAFFISEKMEVLRVLDLEGTSNLKDEDLDQIFRILSLKLLSLRGCKQVSRLPDSLGNLRKLQSLDIWDTNVAILPQSIIKLMKLQYIRSGTVTADDETAAGKQLPDDESAAAGDQTSSRHVGVLVNGVKVPQGFGRLTALNHLGVVDITAASELHENAQLKNLHVSGSSTTLRCRGNMSFPPNLMKLKLDMPTCCLTQEDILAIVKLQKMQTLRIQVKEIRGGLLNFLLCLQHEQAVAAQPVGQLKVIKIHCSLGRMEYDGADPEHPKICLVMPTYCLRQKDIVDIWKLEMMHTLSISANEIHGGLLNFLLCKHEQGDSGSSLAQPFSRPKVIKLHCPLGSVEYDAAAPKQPKISLAMPTYCLRQEDIVDIWKLETMHTLSISSKEIHGGLLNFLLFKHEQGGAGSSLAQPFSQPKVIKIDCPMGSMKYDGMAPNQPKITLEMPTYCLRQGDILDIWKLEMMHTLSISVEEIQGDLLNFLLFKHEQGGAGSSLAQPFSQPKVIKVYCSLGSVEYDAAAPKQPKISLVMPTYCLMQEDIVTIWKLEMMRALHIDVQEIQGDLLNLLLYMLKLDGSGSSIAQPLGQLKVVKITCRLGIMEYDTMVPEQPKLTLEMPCYYLEDLDMKNLGKIKGLHTLSIRFLTNVEGELEFGYLGEDMMPENCFRKLKTLEISSGSHSFVLRFANQTMEELEQLKFNCLAEVKSNWLIDGLERQPSLKEVCLKGSLVNEKMIELQNQLSCHPNRPALKLEDETSSA